MLRAVSTLLEEVTRFGSYPPPPRAASAASILLELVDKLFELVNAVAIDASVDTELVESVMLDVWFVVIAPFVAVSALSTLIEEPLRFVLDT